MKRQGKQHSYRTRFMLETIISLSVIAIAVMVIGFLLFRRFMVEDRIRMAKGLTGLIAMQIDTEKIDEYIELGRESAEYNAIEAEICQLRDAYPDVRYLYVYKILEDGYHVVFDPDEDVSTASEPGEIIPFDSAFESRIPALLAGQEIDPVIATDEYGYLLTIYTPVYDASGVCCCYAAVDFSMNLIMEYSLAFDRDIAVFFLIVLLLVFIGSMLFMERRIIRPMEAMDELAYMDALTGIKNKAAYDECQTRLNGNIAAGGAAFALLMADANFLKRINDTHGHERGNAYLKICANTVCGVFGTDNVYRIGGDEFVVVLEDELLEQAPKLLRAFENVLTWKREQPSLQPWERVSIAIGMAVYDSARDSSAENVLKRADEEMYRKKQAMKATRED